MMKRSPLAWVGQLRPSDPQVSFQQFLRRYEAANSAFVNGDSEAWLAITAQSDPASIFGGFGGGGDVGVGTVRERYLLASKIFRPSEAKIKFTYLITRVEAGLAYTVAIETATVLSAGHSEPQPHVLRVTMLFRQEKGFWKICHRHADTLIDLKLPVAERI